jgi:hypothetical protein
MRAVAAGAAALRAAPRAAPGADIGKNARKLAAHASDRVASPAGKRLVIRLETRDSAGL